MFYKIRLIFLVFSLITLSCPLAIYGQDKDLKKTHTLAIRLDNGVAQYVMAATEYLDSDFNVTRYSIALGAQNAEYSYADDVFILAEGDAQTIYNFTKWVLAFMKICKIEDLAYPNEEFNFTIEYKNWGSLLGKVYFIRRDNKYQLFKKSDIEFIQKKLLEYCKKNNIEVNTNIPIEINPALGKKH